MTEKKQIIFVEIVYFDFNSRNIECLKRHQVLAKFIVFAEIQQVFVIECKCPMKLWWKHKCTHIMRFTQMQAFVNILYSWSSLT